MLLPATDTLESAIASPAIMSAVSGVGHSFKTESQQPRSKLTGNIWNQRQKMTFTKGNFILQESDNLLKIWAIRLWVSYFVEIEPCQQSWFHLDGRIAHITCSCSWELVRFIELYFFDNL